MSEQVMRQKCILDIYSLLPRSKNDDRDPMSQECKPKNTAVPKLGKGQLGFGAVHIHARHAALNKKE